MEKIKPYLDGLKKHHFWLLTAVCIGVILYCWNSATSEIATQFADNQKKVSSEFKKVDDIDRSGRFPNAEWEKKATAKIGEVAGEIKKAANRIIKEQKAVLTWSEDIWSEPFRELATTAKPETWQPEAVEEFRLQITEDIKRLRTVMEAADGTNSPGVQWDSEDYNRLLTAFTMENVNPAGIMTIREIYWVFEALVKIIATTNEGADDKYNLPIHDLEILAVGNQTAMTTLPSDWSIAGLPDAQAVRTPSTRIGYTIRPVRMRVRMDLTKLNKLLAACANSELPLDIRGLRIHRNSGLIEVKTVEEEPKPGFRVGRGGRFGQPKQDETKEEEKKPEENKRGTLVEIIGDVYFVNEQSLEGEISKTGQQTTSLPAAKHGRVAVSLHAAGTGLAALH